MLRTVVILQARMGSTRLPGKVLSMLGDDTLLGHCLRRLLALGADAVVVATSDLERDDPVAEFAAGRGVAVFRGSEQDVLDRYRSAAAAFEAATVVRATGDNPFVDPGCGRELLERFARHGWDYATNHFRTDGGQLPLGTGIEVFSRQALELSWREGTAAHHREHVNEYILENPSRFSLGVAEVPARLHAPDLSLTVDTPEELAFARAMVEEIGRPASELELEHIVSWWRARS